MYTISVSFVRSTPYCICICILPRHPTVPILTVAFTRIMFPQTHFHLHSFAFVHTEGRQDRSHFFISSWTRKRCAGADECTVELYTVLYLPLAGSDGKTHEGSRSERVFEERHVVSSTLPPGTYRQDLYRKHSHVNTAVRRA